MSKHYLTKGDSIPFTQISNEILNASDLSLKAKGLYAFMYSKPNDWHFTSASMASQLKEGKDSILSTLKELINYGLITFKKNTDGSANYIIYYKRQSTKPKKQPKRENPTQGKPHSGKTPLRENPTQGKPHRINNKDTFSNKDLNNNKDFKKSETQTFKSKSSSEIAQMFSKLIQSGIPKDIALLQAHELYDTKDFQLQAQLDKALEQAYSDYLISKKMAEMGMK